MPNIQQAMNKEIRRVARKEFKTIFEQLKNEISELKNTLAETKKQLRTLEAQRSLTPEQQVPTKTETVPATPENTQSKTKPLRINKARIITLRKKMGLSQSQFAKLIGVNIFTVSHWEVGISVPRETQKRKIAQVRDLSKRELEKLFQEKGIIQKGSKPTCTVSEN